MERSLHLADATLAGFLDRWLADVQPELQPTTFDNYSRVVERHLKPLLGAVPIVELRPYHVKDLNSQIVGAGSTQKTAWRAFRVLHNALHHAVTLEVLDRNPATGLTPKKPGVAKFTPLTAKQSENLLAAAKTERLYALYVLALTTGMRQGELFGLQWDDIDFANRRLSLRRQARFLNGTVTLINRTKSGRDRQIMLSKPAIAALRGHQERMKAEVAELRSRTIVREQRDDPDYWRKIAEKIENCPQVFCSPQGEIVAAKNFLRREFYPLLKRTKIPRIRFHDLRHTCATLLLSKNVHPVVVQRLLGHSTISLTIDTYSGWVPTMQEHVVVAMDDLFG
ncbi:MAG: tyrosine-type recombinase/integrase, partial [Vulcanimicrobiaceae bacterium]